MTFPATGSVSAGNMKVVGLATVGASVWIMSLPVKKLISRGGFLSELTNNDGDRIEGEQNA